MNKPQLKTRTDTFYDYAEMAKWIDEKYGIKQRDYAGKFALKEGVIDPLSRDPFDESVPYQDFWHYLLECWHVTNGCMIRGVEWQGVKDWTDHKWQRDIAQLYIDEFGSAPMDIWIEW